MQLNIEEQIPITARVYHDFQIGIPKDVRDVWGIQIGDVIEIYATTKGAFIRKRENKGGE